MLDFLPRVPFRQDCIISRTKLEIKCVCSIAQLCSTLCDPMTVACQAPLSMGFCRQEYWSGLPLPPPGDLPNPRINSISSALQAYCSLLSHQGSSKYLLLGGKAGIWDKGKQQSLQERRGRKILVSKLHKCISCIKFSRFMTDSAFRSSQKFLISFTIKKESKLLG